MMTCQPADRSAARKPASVTRTYVCPQRDQMFLLPVSMRDWICEGHLAWLVLDVVAEMDTSALHHGACVASGRPAYEPEMMCALVLYAYCGGIRSSRRIEAGCVTDAAFRVICGGLEPASVRPCDAHCATMQAKRRAGAGCAQSLHQPASRIMHSNLERQQIATQMRTQRLHRIVLYTFCARKFFLAQGRPECFR